MPFSTPVTQLGFGPTAAVVEGRVVFWSGYADLLGVDLLRAPMVMKQDTDGLPPPCLELRSAGHPFRILWPVEPGDRLFTIWCRHSGHTPRPRVRIAANHSLGVNTDIVQEAQNTEEWHLISVSVTVTRIGVLEVYLELRAIHPNAWVRWDNASAG